MNKLRRKKLEELMGEIERVQAILQEIREDEEEVRDNIPENLQGTEKYEREEEICDQLEGADYSLEEALAQILEAIN